MSALVQYEPFVDNTTRLFLDQTEKLFVNKPDGCDFTTWLQFYAFDVIGEITYSKRHGFIENNEDVEGIVAYLSKLFLYVAPVSPFHETMCLTTTDLARLDKSPFSISSFSRTPSISSFHNGVFSTLHSPLLALPVLAWRNV